MAFDRGIIDEIPDLYIYSGFLNYYLSYVCVSPSNGVERKRINITKELILCLCGSKNRALYHSRVNCAVIGG